VPSLIRATNLWGFETLVRQLGGDPEGMLEQVGVPRAEERPDDSFLPFQRHAQLTELAAASLRCPDFGLRLARWQGLDMLGAVAVIARNASTVNAALGAIASYLYVHSPALQLRQVASDSADRLRFEYRITELPLYRVRQGYEMSMANGMEILRLLAGGDARPAYMSFMHARISPLPVYRRIFGCPVYFLQPWCGFELDRNIGRRRLDSADAETLRLASAYLDSHFPAQAQSLEERVGELIRRLLPTGQCTAAAVAEAMALHPRTLQRQLETCGQRYGELLAAERRALASQYLAQPGLHLSQVAGLLGYAEQSSFNRACRRWFGCAPRQWRRRLLDDHPRGD